MTIQTEYDLDTVIEQLKNGEYENISDLIRYLEKTDNPFQMRDERIRELEHENFQFLTQIDELGDEKTELADSLKIRDAALNKIESRLIEFIQTTDRSKFNFDEFFSFVARVKEFNATESAKDHLIFEL